MKKCFVCLLLAAALLMSAQAAFSAELNGYGKQTGYQYVTFGSYPTDADGGVQPILWRVMKTEDGAAFLLTEYILDVRKLHGEIKTYKGWEKSDMYAFLNGEFKDKAFDQDEQAALVSRTEDGALVTLVSGDDYNDESIGFGNKKSRLCESTEYAKSQGLYIYSKGHKYSRWWSRTRSTDNPDQQRRVMDEGATGRIAVTAKDLGVRPMAYIDMSRVEITGGSGTMSDPFRLAALTDSVVSAPEPTAEPTATADEPIEDQPATDDPITPEATDIPREPVLSAAPKAASEGINPRFEGLAEDGFLAPGEEEFVLSDADEGLWLYAASSLRVEIKRFYDEKKPLRWYEAEIFARDGEIFRAYPFNADKYKNPNVATIPTKMAKQHHLVFAINGDNFFYRVGRSKEVSYRYPIGLVLRGGEELFDVPRNAGSTVFPPLDVLATYADGDMRLFENGGITAKDALAGGAVDTYSFGPILVENGEISPRASLYGEVDNPRIALGMVEKGHYIVVLCESRTGDSTGESCVWLAEKMESLGCDIALNLDGGQTASIIFMGNLVNKTAKYVGESSERPQNEVIGIGVSASVQ